MADQRSKEIPAFSFASRTFAYHRLTQGLSRCMSPSSSFFRENFDPVIEAADQCAKYVDDIGIAANDPQQLLRNLKAVLACMKAVALKLTLAKCHFEVQQVVFLGQTITPQGVAPQKHNLIKLLENVKYLRCKNSTAIYRIFELL